MIRKKKMLVALAEIFGQKLTESRMALYCEVLRDLPDEQVEKAIGMALRDASIKFFPLPAQLREYVNPTLAVDDAAMELISRLNSVFSLFGYVDPDGARGYLGPIVWDAIGGHSGYFELCRSNTAQMPTIRAQIREIVKSKLRAQNPGGRISPEDLPKLPATRTFIPMLADPETVAEDAVAKRNGELTSGQVLDRKIELTRMLEAIGGIKKL